MNFRVMAFLKFFIIWFFGDPITRRIRGSFLNIDVAPTLLCHLFAIGIGRPSRAFPPTPPGIRIRTMAVRKIDLDLSLAEIRQSKLL